MINWQEIENTIQNWVKEKIDSPVIWEDQSESRPSGPYGSLRYLSGPTRKGNDEYLKADADKFKTSGLREFTVSVNIYKADSFSKCFDLLSSIEEVLVVEMFNAAGFCYVSASDIKNLTRLMGPRFESRFQFDVRFRLRDIVESNPGVIENIEIENQMNDNLIEVP